MRLRLALIPAVVAALFVGQSQAASSADTDRFDLGADVTPYRRFLIYPHVEKAQAALRRGDTAQAVREFERARQLAPQNATIALQLAEAYRANGTPERARGLLEAQRSYTPQDARIDAALSAFGQSVSAPSAATSASTPAEPSPPGLMPLAVPQRPGPLSEALLAVQAGDLASAERALGDRGFANSGEGIQLRRAIAQRAIYLGDWVRADAQLQSLSGLGEATRAEQAQWLRVLLQRGKTTEAVALQQGAGLFDAELQLAVAQALAAQGNGAALERYMASRSPSFSRAQDERQWMVLLGRVASSDLAPLRSYEPRFVENRGLRANMLVPRLLSAGDVTGAARILSILPDNALLDSRFEVALRQGQLDSAGRYAATLQRQRPDDMALLDSLSYRLFDKHADTAAFALLMEAYPFTKADVAQRAALVSRVFSLMSRDASLASATQRKMLSQPLRPDALRSVQVTHFAAERDCDAILSLLDSLAGNGYSAADWMALGQCYQHEKPGLAEYAFERAQHAQGGAATTRALAYQAFATHDYATALGAWREVPAADMGPAEYLAAATTAVAADDPAQADVWLDGYAASGAVQDAAYWSLRAQAGASRDGNAAYQDLQRAIALRPDASLYARMASVDSARGDRRSAVTNLEHAVALDPDNAELAASLGHAYASAGRPADARTQLERAAVVYPDDVAITQALVYANQRLADNTAARRYARQAVDDLKRDDPRVDGRSDEIADREFGLRRLHEDLARRWTFSADAWGGSQNASAINASQPGVGYRSFAQLAAEYRLGREPIRDGRTLSAYARVFAGDGGRDTPLPVYAPMLGAGLSWKPWRSQVIYFAAEQQVPLDNDEQTKADVMLRASASFFNAGRFSDDWHPSGRGWMAQNLYLDVAHYVRADRNAFTADYRASWHQKVFRGAQTIEPYGRAQYNFINDNDYGFQRDVRIGVGVRWNWWYGQTRYDAYRHRTSFGIEFQHAFQTYQDGKGADSLLLTFGGRW
ncbi:tetratricopeptide repeat protein [Uliginosibacterium sp. sgz301328]|uniref:NfrA family protein n=1 Tax=Uliginosibacterium sp. sgz301328 TaxID=3243764 RepID=UPI00359D430D